MQGPDGSIATVSHPFLTRGAVREGQIKEFIALDQDEESLATIKQAYGRHQTVAAGVVARTRGLGEVAARMLAVQTSPAP